MRFLLPLFGYDRNIPTAFTFLIIVLSLFPVAFPARNTPGLTTYGYQPLTVLNVTSSSGNTSNNHYHTTTTGSSTTWNNFSKFVDLEKGANLTGVSDLKKYLFRFGYLPNATTTTTTTFSDVFDSDMQSAVLHYQKNLGLSPTGRLDSDTISVIMAPRCGVSDIGASDPRASAQHHLHQTGHFQLFSGRPRWVRRSPTTLTYAVSKDHVVGYLSEAEIMAVFARAFDRWSKVIPVNFRPADSYGKADIKIGFYSGDHGDGEAFDGVLGVLAHAFSPENGRLHLDAAETWAVDFKRERSKVAVDLESVATHEIGHVLGLAHSSVKDAIMYPSLRPRSKKIELKVDDVEGVQALYGSNPNFELDTFLESEETSSSSNNSSSASGRGETLYRCWWWLCPILCFFITLL